jgi:hypothetical protein
MPLTTSRRTGRCRYASLALIVIMLPGWVAAQSAGGRFTITKEVIGGGGGRHEAGPVTLTSTVAQPAAATHAGGRFRLSGGFHQPRTATREDSIFRNGFEPL